MPDEKAAFKLKIFSHLIPVVQLRKLRQPFCTKYQMKEQRKVKEAMKCQEAGSATPPDCCLADRLLWTMKRQNSHHH